MLLRARSRSAASVPMPASPTAEPEVTLGGRAPVTVLSLGAASIASELIELGHGVVGDRIRVWKWGFLRTDLLRSVTFPARVLRSNRPC